MNYALSPNRGWETNGRLFQVNVSVEEVNLSNNRFQDNVADMFVSALCENYAIKSNNPTKHTQHWPSQPRPCFVLRSLRCRRSKAIDEYLQEQSQIVDHEGSTSFLQLPLVCRNESAPLGSAAAARYIRNIGAFLGSPRTLRTFP